MAEQPLRKSPNHITDSEDELLRRAIAGDREALTILFKTHGPAVRQKLQGKIDRRWSSVLSVDDIMQETFTDAFLSIRQFRAHGQDAFPRWLARLARNNLLDAIRGYQSARRGGHFVRVGQRDSDEPYIDLYERLVGPSNSPFRNAAINEAKAALRRAWDHLPETYQLIVSLYDLAECPPEEVAEICECSVGAMYMRRARAHVMLQKFLGSGFSV